MKNRQIVVGVSLVALIALAIAALVALDWDRVRDRLAVGSERTRVALFRFGELMSIAAELESRYGRRPEMSYETVAGERVLEIRFGPLDGGEPRAREIAEAALGLTEKRDQVDVVVVRLGEPYRFERSADHEGRLSP